MTETAVPKIIATASAGDPVDLRRVHFVGIGGAGMLPLARVCAERGFTVSGSDMRQTKALEVLAGLGVRVHTGHAATQVPADATAVVFTHALDEDNPELQAAREHGVPLVHRSTVLNALMASTTAIGVLGTHGKTSVAGMLAHALTGMGHAPTYVVGGDIQGPASGGHAGNGDVFVAEVDESDRTHLNVHVNVAVLTNIEFDHPENYGDASDHITGYEQFALGMQPGGTLVLNADSRGCRELASRLALAGRGPRLVWFGTSAHATWRVTNAVCAQGEGMATLRGPGGAELDLTLRVPGTHQLLNAAAATAAAHAVGLDGAGTAGCLGTFEGVARRMSPAGEVAGVRVYDSYAHHPSEITADLAAARSLLAEDGGRVIAVFQPAGQARHEAFGGGFAAALADCDEVVLTGHPRVGQEAVRGLSAAVDEAGGRCRGVEWDRATAAACAVAVARPGDVVVLIGTGDLAEYGQAVTGELSRLVEAAA
ncbi:UDP-N-acetylmuramate--L-alanine ligase [Streptomyces antimycoticus]|uniref:UDP-N-acetylmuramate--L-alanine ligase n=1 Tax=Streptomyces antimycoticus TaxID=68175 RepID=UPI00342587FE